MYIQIFICLCPIKLLFLIAADSQPTTGVCDLLGEGLKGQSQNMTLEGDSQTIQDSSTGRHLSRKQVKSAVRTAEVARSLFASDSDEQDPDERKDDARTKNIFTLPVAIDNSQHNRNEYTTNVQSQQDHGKPSMTQGFDRDESFDVGEGMECIEISHHQTPFQKSSPSSQCCKPSDSLMNDNEAYSSPALSSPTNSSIHQSCETAGSSQPEQYGNQYFR